MRMNEHDSARQRLKDAIATLAQEVDAKLAAVAEDAAGRVAALETEVAALRTDKGHLTRVLRQSEAQARDLREVAQTTGARIDHTIEGIKAVLGAGDSNG